MRSHRIAHPRRFLVALWHAVGMTRCEAMEFVENHRRGLSVGGDLDILRAAASGKIRTMVREGRAYIIADDLWLCQDCVVADCNGDYVGMSEERANEVREGLRQLAERHGGKLVPDFDSHSGDGIREFSWRSCDACGTHLGGYRARYVVVS